MSLDGTEAIIDRINAGPNLVQKRRSYLLGPAKKAPDFGKQDHTHFRTSHDSHPLVRHNTPISIPNLKFSRKRKRKIVNEKLRGWGWSNEVTAAAAANSIWSVDHAKNRNPVKRRGLFFSYVLVLQSICGLWSVIKIVKTLSFLSLFDGCSEMYCSKSSHSTYVYTPGNCVLDLFRKKLFSRLKENGNAASEMTNKMAMNYQYGNCTAEELKSFSILALMIEDGIKLKQNCSYICDVYRQGMQKKKNQGRSLDMYAVRANEITARRELSKTITGMVTDIH
ncbi:hypothetical protein CDAR_476031 [Caerostris darwini]|uniref:Pentatricopeptide repeat-containing protein n=1 Tax=Caerostris darwini TaxID=1538125 RepID=A0AAV4PC02_9ARAC|nr:hypothetical protein CDAR_476031 [Caerostris darwini]